MIRLIIKAPTALAAIEEAKKRGLSVVETVLHQYGPNHIEIWTSIEKTEQNTAKVQSWFMEDYQQAPPLPSGSLLHYFFDREVA